jgi:trigger factor
MQIIDIKKDDVDFQVKIIIPVGDIANKVEKELGNIAKTAKVAGFRVGKVPASIINKKYSPSVRSGVIQDEVQHAIDHVIKDNKLNLASQPRLEDFKAEEGCDIAFTLKCELLPEISLPDFSNILIERPNVIVQDVDIDQHIAQLIELSKSYDIESEEPAMLGDQVTIDAVGYIDDKAFEGGEIKNHKLRLGSKSFIDNFEEQLVGSKPQQELAVNVTFPQDYHAKDLAGKPAKFVVQVNAIHKAITPAVDDEFAKKYNCDSVEKLREQIAKNIKASFADSIHTIMTMSLFDQLNKILEFNLPQTLIEQEIVVLKSQVASSDDSLFQEKSEAEREEYYRKLAIRRIKVGLFIAEYIKDKALAIEQKDIQDAVMSEMKKFPGHEMKILEFYQNNPRAIESLRGGIMEEKGVRHIFDNQISVQDKDYTVQELEEFLKSEDDKEIVI